MTLKSAQKLAKQMMRKHKVNHIFDFSFMDSKTTFGNFKFFAGDQEGSGTSLFCYSFAIESSNNYAVVGSGNIGNGLNLSVQGHYFTSS